MAKSKSKVPKMFKNDSRHPKKTLSLKFLLFIIQQYYLNSDLRMSKRVERIRSEEAINKTFRSKIISYKGRKISSRM